MKKPSARGAKGLPRTGISINCLKTILTPCQPPVASHDWGSWQGVRMDAQAFSGAQTHKPRQAKGTSGMPSTLAESSSW